ncbi:MAG: septal ring lytic transglycosylase RlpA family protein, partial [Pseudomonadota bacterium]
MSGTRKAAFKLSLLTGAIIASMSSQAFAQGAPITFGEASTRSSAMPSQSVMTAQRAPVSPVSAATNTDPRTRRIEFRYPDQPNTFYSADGTRAAQSDEAPIAFSSQETAISQADARQYAALPEPEIQRDPAITTGGFDARAAARAVEVRERAAQGQSTRISATQPKSPAPTGQPLTLSKVRANPDAAVSQERGLASVYDRALDGEKTANGEVHDRSALMAAHRTLPLPSLVQVINEDNNREIVVRVNDRGPFDPNRVLDLSERSAEMLGITQDQPANITLRYLGPAPVAAVQADPQTLATVVSEDMAPPQRPKLREAFVTEPSLGVPDPMDAAAPAPRTQGRGNVYIQVGSFTDIGNAENLDAAIGRGLPVK